MINSENEVGTPDFCRNLPKKPTKSIPRDNLMEHIETVFRDAARCILLEGEAQSGKSEFLASFLRKHSQDSVGVFLSPGDAYFYSPEYAKLVLAEQIHWILNGKPGNYDSIDDATYKSLLYKLQKLAGQKPITFVIDGLTEKIAPEGKLREDILNLLPFSQQNFRFLIAGTGDLEPDLRKHSKSFKSVPLIQIAQEEAAEFFADITELTPKDVSDIRKFCSGSIGRMTKLRAIIQTNKISLNEILNERFGELEDLMEMEWLSFAKNEALRKLLAFLCFANRPLHLERLAEFSGIEKESLQRLIEESSFIDSDSASCLVSIRSNAQKHFLRKKLQEFESTVQESFLKELLANPDSIESDRYLPAQLLQVGKYDDLVQRLDAKHFCRLLNSEKSLRALKVNLDLGLKAAKHIGDEAQIARFGMSKSVVGGITLSVGSQGRIQTLVAMGQIDEAIALSLAAPSREEALKHLAATAKAIFDERKTIPNSIRTEVKNLLEDLSVDTLGDMAIAIACDLIVVDFEAAVDLFNKANAVVKNEKTTNTPNSHEKGDDKSGEKSLSSSEQTTELRLSERHRRRFSQVIGQMVDRTAPEKICDRVRQSTDYSSDLVFMKEWIGRRRTDPRAFEVAHAAIDVILKDLKRSPRIEDLRTIAVVLPHVDDTLEAEKLSKRIQALVSTELLFGNSVEAVRLQMLLIETQYRVTPDEAELAWLDVLLEVEVIADISIRVACLSWVLFALKQLPTWEILEAKTSLISHATSSLMDAIECLLQNSADHLAAVKTALPALTRADIALTMKVCGSLNTETRRDSAFSLSLAELFTLMKYSDEPACILQFVDKIIDENTRSKAILNGLSQVVDHLKSSRSVICNEGVASLWKKLRVPNYRFMGLRYAIQIALLTKQSDSKISFLKDEIDKCWSANEIDWVRWELGYSLVRDMYSSDKIFANDWFSKIAEEEKSLRSPSESVSDVLKLTASLAVRAYSYLAPSDFKQSEDFGKLAQLVASIAVPDERLQMWCELGIRLHYSGKYGFSKYICKNYVEPMLPISSASIGECGFGHELTLALAAPFLYLIHEATGQFTVDKISDIARRDSAIQEICFTLLRKVANTDGYKDPGSDGYDLTVETATSIVSLIGKMSTDWIIFGVVEALTDSLGAKKNERRIRRLQVADILNTLETSVKRILPDRNNIKHAGFLISSLAQINRARQSAGLQVAGKTWQDLFADARALSNVSDRAVVTAFVAVGARGKQKIIPDDWLEQIRQDVKSSPTVLDQIDRYVWLAEILEGFDKKQSLQLARAGMSLTKNVGEGINVYQKKRKLLDIVLNIDPDLAGDFIELSDGDRARRNDKAALEARVKIQRLQKEAASHPDNLELREESDRDIAELAMRNLSALNANRIVPRAVEDFKNLISRAHSLPFDSAYCVWSWMLENAIRKGGLNSKGEKVVINAFQASLSAGELIISLLNGAFSALNPNGASGEGLVRPGGREDALALILDWAKVVDGQPIVITDPYFGPEDLELLFEMAKAAPRSSIRVLTGRRHLRGAIADSNFETAFLDAWHAMCDAVGSDIEICVVGVNSDGDHPIHDRWILSGGCGLRMGTSAKSLGNFRVSEVCNMTEEEVPGRLELVNGFLDRRTRQWEGGRVMTSSFSL